MKLIPIKNRRGEVIAWTKVDNDVVLPYTVRIDGRGYAVVNTRHPEITGRYYTKGVHRLVMGLGYGDKRQVDHINHDVLDNRRENLKIVNHSENAQNRTVLDPRNQSGYLGVCYSKERGVRGWAAWYGRKKILGNIIRTSYFNSPELAYQELQKLLERVAP